MKRIKISMIAVIALVMGIAASAFTIQSGKTDTSDLNSYWYNFIGDDPTDVGEVTLPEKYEYQGGIPCGTEGTICAVKVEASAEPTLCSHPASFSSQMEDDLEAVAEGDQSNYPDISREQ